MTVRALARWVDQHHPAKPTKITDKGTLIIYSWVCGANGWEIEENEASNLAEARAILGY